MQYSDAQLRVLIRDVVREARATAHVDTGYLKRSIKGDIVKRNNSVEFRQIFYGAYNNNSKLVEIAERIMPRDVQWKVVFLDEEGNETQVKATTRTGRTISRKAINSESIYTSKIKSFISLIRGYGKKKDNAGAGD